MIYEEVFKAFDKEKVDYIIVGGIALNLLGLMRATADLDILIDIVPENLAKVHALMSSIGYKLKQPINMSKLDAPGLAKLIREKHLKAINYYRVGELKEVDFIIDSPVSFKRALTRAQKISVGAISLRVICVDDLIAMKKAVMRDIDKLDILQLKKLKKIEGRQ